VRCGSYDSTEVNDSLQRGLELLGGSAAFFKPRERILLKPNVLWAAVPPRPVVTNPAVLRAAGYLLQKTGVTVSYGDSPAGILSALHSMKVTGLAAAADELNIPIAEFDHGRAVSYPQGITSKNLFIANGVLEADGVVSLPKLKAHGLTRMTGAIKNQFGCVPKLVKGEYHARFPDPLEFSRLLADITGFVHPRLYIMDAVIAMEGNGPQNGDPKKLGLLLLSNNPVAMDVVACRLINLDPSLVPTIDAAVKARLGSSDMNDIVMKGDPIEQFIDVHFKVARVPVQGIPKNRYLRELRRMITRKPVIRSKLCSKCGRCIEMCPVDPKAISWKKDTKKSVPVYRQRECIRCFCCHEVCPSKAIHIKTPLIGKLLPAASYLGLLYSRRHSRKTVHG